jgi:hypothetical protein
MDPQLTVDNLCGALRQLFAAAAKGEGPPPGCNVLKLQGVPDAEVARVLDACGGVLHVELRAQVDLNAPRPQAVPKAPPVSQPPQAASPGLVITGPFITVEDPGA